MATFYLDLGGMIGQLQQTLISLFSPTLQSIFNSLTSIQEKIRQVENSQMSALNEISRLRLEIQNLRQHDNSSSGPTSPDNGQVANDGHGQMIILNQDFQADLNQPSANNVM